MTYFLLWIVFLFVQKSSSLTSEVNEIPSSLTSEHSSSDYDATHIPTAAHFNEEPSLTTSANDIECSNTEGCASPRNLFSTSTTPPDVSYKVSWRPFTLKRASTEAPQMNTHANSDSYTADNPTTSKVQDTTVQPTNDDVGNELDSEVKLNEYFTPKTVASTDELVESESGINNLLFNNSDVPTILTMPENISEIFIATSTQEYTTTGPTMNVASVILSENTTKTDDVLTSIPKEQSVKDFNAVPSTNDPSRSVPLEEHSIDNVPLSFSSPEATATTQKNLVDIFHENASITTSKMADDTTFSEDEITSQTVGQPESNAPREFTGLTAEYSKEFISSSATLRSETDESKFQVTNMRYIVQENIENTTTEPMTSTESAYSVNTPYTEISEGHGLRRNLSYFIPSTEQSVMKTENEAESDRLTELNPTKDISKTNLLATSSSHSDEIASSTILLENPNLSEMSSVGTSYPDSTFESMSNVPNFSEQIKYIPPVTKHYPTTHLPSTSSPASSTFHAVVGVDDKEIETSTLALLLSKGRMYEEGIAASSTLEPPINENVASESSTLTSEAPSTENGISMLPTTIPQSQPNIREETTPTSTIVAETISYSNPSISTHFNNLDSQFTTKLITEISNKTNSDPTTSQSSTHSYTTDEASETTTINPVEAFPSTTIPSIDIPASLSEMDVSVITKSTVTYSSSAPSLTTASPTDSVTTQQRMGRKDLEESTTVSSWEQTTPVPPTLKSAASTVVSSIYTQPDTQSSTFETYPSSSTTSSVAPTDSEDSSMLSSSSISTMETTKETDQHLSATSSVQPTYSDDSSILSYSPISTMKTSKESDQQFLATSSVASDFSTDSSVLFTISSTSMTGKEYPRTDSVIEDVKDSSTTSSFSTALPPVKLFTQTETRREGKHIPFSTVSTRRETVGLSENGIIRVTSTDPPTENGTKTIYQQMQFEELMTTEKANIITAAIQFSSKRLGMKEMEAKMVQVHTWLLHVLMKEFQNWTRDPFEETEDESGIAPFGNISIFYITPTPEINSSGITLTFIVYNVWKNETLQVDFVLGILNYYSKELKESINASAAYFYHGFEADDRYLMSAILERYGVVIITIGLAVVLILLLVCVVVFYRKKTRRSVHCLANSKFKQSMHEAVGGIDLNPAVVILQDEKVGNKICDDEGWLAPIDDVPRAEDSNVPFVQDTKL